MALNSSQQRRQNRTNSDYPGTIFSATNVLLDFVEDLDPDDVRHWTPVQQRDAVGFIRHCIHVMCADPMAVIPGHPGGPHIVYMLAQSDLYFFLLVALFEACHSSEATAEVDLPRCGMEEFIAWIGRDVSENAQCIDFIGSELTQFYESISESVTDAGYEAQEQQPFVYTDVSGPYMFRLN